MASTISTSPLCSSSSTKNKPTLFSISSSLLLHPRATNHRLSNPQLSAGLSSPWSGLRHLGAPVKHKFVRIERKERNNAKVVHASLFGVGAPEVLVIGVVALLVFGPKGLAEVARTLGKTLRAFQPTIREIQDVSKEFRSTLEQEIGLNDIPPPVRNTSSSTAPTTSPSSANNENSQTQTPLDSNGIPLTGEILESKKEQLEAIVHQTTLEEQSENQPQSQVQDGALPTAKPFSIGEVLVEAQRRKHATKTQEQTAPHETQSELEPQPEKQELTAPQESQSEPESQPTAEVNPTTTPPKMSEGEK